jgi:polar amino acid transport system substrate-binding protein
MSFQFTHPLIGRAWCVVRKTSKLLRTTHYALRTTKFIAALAFTLILLLLAWRLLAPRDDGTLADIQRRGTLRVGLDASFPPFEVMDGSGRIVGLDVDLAQAVAADLGVELELVNIGFDGLYDALLARRVDVVISGLPYDPRWTEDVAYTVNYFNAGQVLVAAADNGSIVGLENLSGQTVAVEWGSQADMEGRQLAEERPTVTLLREPSAAEAVAAVSGGQAEAAIVDAVSGLSAGPEVRLVTYLTDEWYAAAVHLESQTLLAAVNQTLTRLRESGEMDRMQERWLRTPPPTSP